MSALKLLGITPNPERKAACSEDQAQTQECFGFKWAKRDTYESEAVKANLRRWLMEKYCENDASRLDGWFEGNGKIILDAGCGSGLSASVFLAQHLERHHYLGVDISQAIEVAEQRFQEAGLPGDFLQCDLMQLPIPDASVDVIFSEGVLHHTDDTKAALTSLAAKLKPGGLFLFYVYAKKSDIREFTDDHVRGTLSVMSDEEAWSALEPLTRLGMALGEIDAEITIPEKVDLLGIEAGTYSLQRFFYWHVLKAYYHPELTLEEMLHINFDWFRPLNCHRHTAEEVRHFCEDAGLEIEQFTEQRAGFAVAARRR